MMIMHVRTIGAFPRRRQAHLILAAMTLAAACGELGVETMREPALTQLSLSALPANVLEADTLQLTVAAQGAEGFVLDSLRATSSNPTVLTALASRVGRSVTLVAIAPGTADLEVTAFASGPGLRASVERAALTVTVSQARAACSGAVLELPRSTLWVGELQQARPAVTREVTSVALSGEHYTSSDPTVVEVTPAGTVRGLRAGSADLTFAVTCSGTRLRTQRVEARLPVSVTNETVTLSRTRDSAKTGRAGEVSAVVGNVRPGGTSTVTWLSRNAAVASVASNGVWQAVSPGRTHLVARSTAGGQAQDSVAILVDDGCGWTRPYRLGESVQGELAGSGPCSRHERFVVDLPATTTFEVSLSAGGGSDVVFFRDPGFNGGWPTLARAGLSSLDLYTLPAGRHVLQVENFEQTAGSFALSSREFSAPRCSLKLVRGVTVTASIDEQCAEFAVFLVDPTPAGARTRIRVTSSAFPPEVELLAWDPELRVVSRADGLLGVPAIVEFTTPTSSAMSGLVRSRTGARGTLVITLDP